MRRTYSSDDPELPPGVVRFCDLPGGGPVLEGTHERVETVEYGPDGQEVHRRVRGVRQWTEGRPVVIDSVGAAWRARDLASLLGYAIGTAISLLIWIPVGVVLTFIGGFLGLMAAPPPAPGAAIGCLLGLGATGLLWRSASREDDR